MGVVAEAVPAAVHIRNREVDKMDFQEIMNQFQIEGKVTEVSALGQGTVNHTYQVICGQVSYVLQEINHVLFKYPIEVMNNLFLVTEYLREKIESDGGNPDRETLTFIRTKDENQLLQTQEGSYFRLYKMVEDGLEMERPETAEEAYQAAAVLGKFQHRMVGFDAALLSYTFPQMHQFKTAIRHLLDAVRADICSRTSDCQEQIRFVLNRSEKLYKIEEAVANGQIPKRVTHNDPGYDNVLIDEVTKEAICMIDLDTLMPGASIYDFGAAVRIGAASEPEYVTDGDVYLDLEKYRAYLEGYLSYMGTHLNEQEKDLLGYSVWVMTMEKGIHYLTEYLSGDRNITDFSNEKQNLFCAVNQFFLVLDMEEKEEEMSQILKEVRMNTI